MPNPSGALTTLRPELGGSVEQFDLEMSRAGFIGLRIMPLLEVGAKSGTFGIIPIKELLQNKDTERAPGSGYQRGKFKFTTESFATQEHGWEEPVDDLEAKIYASYFDAEAVSTRRAVDFVLRSQERRIAALVQNTGTFTTTAFTTPWSTHASCTPIDDIDAMARRIWLATGMWPDALQITRNQYKHVRNSAQILDRVKYVRGTLPTEISPADLAAAFDVSEVIIANSAQNTANEGQDVAISSIWSDEYVALFKKMRTNDIREPGFGRTLHWSEDGSQPLGLVESYRDETVRSEIIRVRHDVQEKTFFASALQLGSNVIDNP